jgi:hypothetical protein
MEFKDAFFRGRWVSWWALCDDVVVLVVEGFEGEYPEGLLLHPVAAYAVVVDLVLLQELQGRPFVALGDVEEELLVLPSVRGDLREDPPPKDALGGDALGGFDDAELAYLPVLLGDDDAGVEDAPPPI